MANPGFGFEGSIASWRNAAVTTIEHHASPAAPTSDEDGVPVVFIVDDDDAIRESLAFLMDSAGLSAQALPSAQAFLDAYGGQPGCLLLDVRMPGMTGLELLARVKGLGIRLPVILLTGHGDVPMAVRAMSAGAFHFFEKPFDDRKLLEKIQQAIDHDRRERHSQQSARRLAARMNSLSPRERQVLDLVVAGLLNWQMAAQLQISEKTIESHRASMMRKMEAQNVVDLVHMVVTARQVM
jgi:FixJ family two-component response regulator